MATGSFAKSFTDIMQHDNALDSNLNLDLDFDDVASKGKDLAVSYILIFLDVDYS
jgi:hypothetical protein